MLYSSLNLRGVFPKGASLILWLLMISLLPAQQLVSRMDEMVRPGDSIWEVSTRHLPDSFRSPGDSDFHVHQLVNCYWNSSTIDALIDDASANAVRTIIHVHGNWMPVCDGRERSLLVYKAIAERSVEPIRLIAFSWPSEQRDWPARDVIEKKPMIACNAFHLANLIERLPPGQPEGIVGYSFGAAIVSGSLHLIAGGTLGGQALSTAIRPVDLMRVSLIAPAFDRTDLAPCGHYSQALNSVDCLVNLYNSRDPILRRFRFFDRSTEPVAAGYSGLAIPRSVSPLDASDKVKQYDCRAVGRSHSEVDYFTCPAIECSINNLLGR